MQELPPFAMTFSPQWNPDPSKVLGVFGLSLYTSEREIQDLYSKFGGVERVQVIHDHIVSWG